MINKHLEKELKYNKKNHEIFQNQEYRDLKEITEVLHNQSNSNDLLVEFSPENHGRIPLLYTFPFDSYEHKRIWEHFIALEIMKNLTEKYQVDVGHNLKEEELLLQSGNIDKQDNYLNHEENIVNRNDVLTTIKELNLPNLRIHFLIRWCKSSSLCDEISNYLEDNLPFITMVYHDFPFYTVQVKPDGYNERHWIWEVYDYIKFDELEQGVDSSKIRIKKILPEREKQKVKKHGNV